VSVPASIILCHMCLLTCIGYKFRRSLAITEVMKLMVAVTSDDPMNA